MKEFDLQHQFQLNDSVAVVTGGASGIGKATATVYGKLGAKVALVDRDTKLAEQTANELAAAGAIVRVYNVDVTDEAAVAGACDGIVKDWGRLDILVNNAALVMRKPSVDLPIDDWNRVIGVNLTGVFIAARHAARHMIKQRSGCIVNVASIGGLQAGTTGRQYPNASYRASKGGVVNLTRALAVEWASHNIRVNAVAPGYVRTPMTSNIDSDPERLKSVMAAVPLGRLAEPFELAWPIAFLTSRASAMITGQIIVVDGGALA